MIPTFEMSSCDVEIETQFLLLEARNETSIHDEAYELTAVKNFCILFLRMLDGQFSGYFARDKYKRARAFG